MMPWTKLRILWDEFNRGSTYRRGRDMEVRINLNALTANQRIASLENRVTKLAEKNQLLRNELRTLKRDLLTKGI